MGLAQYIIDIGRAVAFHPNLKKVTGSTNATLLLCQLLYWTDKTDDGWIRKTSDMIEEETGLTYNEQKTARDILRELGIISDVYKRLDHEISFRVNQDVLNDLWEEAGGEKLQRIEKKKPREKKPVQKKVSDIGQQKKGVPVTPDILKEAFSETNEENVPDETIGTLYPRKKDYLDALLGEDAVKANDVYEKKRYIAETIERKLNLTDIMSNSKWIAFVDFAYSRYKKHGEEIDVFLNWTLHNEAYNPAYWTPGKMRTLWSQAFVSNEPDENFVRKTELVQGTPEEEVVPPPFDLSLKNNLFGD